MTDQKQRDEFIKINPAHAVRLGAIIEDLLTLSGIEKESERKEIKLTEGNIKLTLESAILLCQSRASDKNIQIELDFPDERKVKRNSPLMEQAIVKHIALAHDGAVDVKSEINKGSVFSIHLPA